jgi:hypothetical protein
MPAIGASTTGGVTDQAPRLSIYRA